MGKTVRFFPIPHMMTDVNATTACFASRDTIVVPPINFSLVAPDVYRSGHPNRRNFSFLRRLKLKGIM